MSDPCYTLIVPVREPGDQLSTLLRAVARQSLAPRRTLVVETRVGPTDVAATARSFGAEHLEVAANDFDHAGTRSHAASLVEDPYVVFVSQDTRPASDRVFESLVRTIDSDTATAAAYGRQIPPPKASDGMRLKRAYLYPETSACREGTREGSLDHRSALLSNAFSVYRVEALRSVGWFGERLLMCEDVLAASRLLALGHSVRYEAAAAVIHEHRESYLGELRRTFDIGASHAEIHLRLGRFGGPNRLGLEFVRFGIRELLRERSAARVPGFLLVCCQRWLAYQTGRRHAWLPMGLKRRLSARPQWWR